MSHGGFVSIDSDYPFNEDLAITFLFYAVMTGNLEVALLLRDYGAPLECGDTALPVIFAAAWMGGPAAMQLMVEWKADGMVGGPETGMIALHIAAGGGL